MLLSSKNLIIRASAGTGKTHQLSNRFLSLLFSGASIENILAITFTRKAAGEILQRILFRLATAAIDRGDCRELAKSLKIDSLSCQQCSELLSRLTENLHRVRVSTLDSFFAQVARCYGLELDIPAVWQIVEEGDDRVLRGSALGELLDRHETRDAISLVHLLTKGEATRGLFQLLQTTIGSLFWLYQDSQPDAWNTLGRVKPLDDAEVALLLEDLHDAPLPDDSRVRKAREKDYRLALNARWDDFIAKGSLSKKIVQGETCYYRKEIPSPTVEAYQHLIDHARAVLIGRLVSQAEGTFQLLDRFDQHYQQEKRRQRALRFEDVTRSLTAVHQSGHLARLAFRLDAGVDHVLLDEFQDTSLAQWQVVRSFAKRAAAGKDCTFFCVGDPKQAIYGWRGGDARIFDCLPNELSDLNEERLDKSFRSCPPVIETVNRVFSSIDAHDNLGREERAVMRWKKTFPPHDTARQDLSGMVEMITAPRSVQGNTQPETTLEFAADYVARAMEKHPAGTIGVLVRKNVSVARLIYELGKRGVPASEEGGNPVTDSAAVQTVLSLLRIADHPSDTVARFHVANSPLGKRIGFVNADDDRLSQDLAINLRRQLLDAGYGVAVDQWVASVTEDVSSRDSNRLQQLVELAFRYQSRATLRTRDFLRFVEDQRLPEPSSAGVRVMTIHQAKGLQFETVVLPELDGQLLGETPRVVFDRPSAVEPVNRICMYTNSVIQSLLPATVQTMFRSTDDRLVNESLCVLYVALTRAARSLAMIIAPSSSNEKRLPRTSAGLLRAALTEGTLVQPSSTIYECGNPNWHRSLSCDRRDTGLARGQPRLARSARPRLRFASKNDRSIRDMNSAAPSSLAGGRHVQRADYWKPETTAGTIYGTIIHAWMEQIEWLDEGTPSEQLLRQIADQVGTGALDVDRLVDDFRKMLERATISHTLSRAAYEPPKLLPLAKKLLDELCSAPLQLTVHNEPSIAVRERDQILAGNIDRLVTMSRNGKFVAADIIDFKTDKIDTNSKTTLDQKVAHYRPQIEAYRQATSQMLRLPTSRISARLLFVGCGEIRTIR